VKRYAPFLLAGLFSALALLFVLAPRGARNYPAPTEHTLDEDAERRNRTLRRAWIEEMHRAAPDVDWRAIERANGAERQRVRNETPRPRISLWTELGSRNLAGRMHAAALSASGDSLYGGSSRGGVWKASLNGEGWRPLGDNLFGGSHGIAVAAGPPEIVTSITDDGLLHYTDDGGATWLVPAGPEPDLTQCKRVLSDPGTPNRVYLLARKDATSSKLWRSDDGGRTYTRIARLGPNPADIWIDRVSGGSLYLLSTNRLLRTDDAGASWDTLGLLPPASPGNVVLTGSEAGAPTLYAAAESGGWKLYRSSDGGWTWTYRHDIHDFWETLCASIADPNLVLFAGVEMWRSTDGGGAFAKVNNWWDYYGDPLTKLHADFPGTDCVWGPSGEIFYISTDGGLYRSDDGVARVTNISLEYLGVSQYYSTLTSVNDPSLILAGSQDQGYQRSLGEAIGTWRDFDQLWSGDYGHLTSTDGSHNRVYSVYPGFFLIQKGETNPVLSSIDFPAGESYSWMPFILADPEDSLAFFFSARRLHLYRVGTHGWSSTVSAQDFTVHGGAYLTALGISPVDTDRRIAVTNSGIVWYSTDGGAAWSVSPDNGPSAHYFYGTAVAFSPTDPEVAFLGGSGYSGPAVYRTEDGGITWDPASDGLPSTLVYGLAFEDPSGGPLYAAAEAGPYRRDPATGLWEAIGAADAPLTTYWCVEAVPAASVMRFGTYGRGIWDYDTGVQSAVASAENDAHAASALESFPNPFNAAATIRFYLKDSGPFTLAIYEASGRRVRLLASESRAAGEHEIVWDGTSDRGMGAASGVYTARLESGGRAWTRRMVLAR